MARSTILQTNPLGFIWETDDPFLFCVHHRDRYPAGVEDMGPPPETLEGRTLGADFEIRDSFRMYHGDRVPGFPMHPHRGFETVTIVLQGVIDHADSLGAAGRYGAGDAQWMTAGSGIQHAEMFPLVHRDRANTLELFQIWLNLPRERKMVPPHYKMFWQSDIPTKTVTDDAGKETSLTLVTGPLPGATPPAPPPDSWAADPGNHVAIWIGRMAASAVWTLPSGPDDVYRALYVFEGAGINVAGEKLTPDRRAVLRPDADIVMANGPTESRFLFLQGAPIRDPVVQYGPFAMTTEEEIAQAFEAYRKTGFGRWPWPRPDPVHPRGRGRFARYADGRETSPRE